MKIRPIRYHPANPPLPAPALERPPPPHLLPYTGF